MPFNRYLCFSFHKLSAMQLFLVTGFARDQTTTRRADMMETTVAAVATLFVGPALALLASVTRQESPFVLVCMVTKMFNYLCMSKDIYLNTLVFP